MDLIRNVLRYDDNYHLNSHLYGNKDYETDEQVEH